MYGEEEYLMLSGIQHFVFCRRQWALIHVEQQWAENYRTVDGSIMHKNVHDTSFHEKRGDTVIVRAMAVSSHHLGICGECDVVELKKNDNGINVFGLEGKYQVVPIEYKRGKPKENESDILQLTAQAMCLEDMLCCKIEYGYLFYGETRHRIKVIFTDELKSEVIKIVEEMHSLFNRRYTPKTKQTKACNACSLKEICLPVLCKKTNVADYYEKMLGEDR